VALTNLTYGSPCAPAPFRAESVTETEYRDILKTETDVGIEKTEKYRKTEEKTKIRFLLMMIFTISTTFFAVKVKR